MTLFGRLKEINETGIKNINTALNISIRCLANFLVMLFFPAYVFVVFMSHNEIFSYDMFSSGKFGIEIFFYFVLMIAAFFLALIALPAECFHEIRLNCKAYSSWFFIFLYIIIDAVLLYFFHSSKIFIGILLPSLIILILTILAFEAKTKNYIVFLCVGIGLLLYLPLHSPANTTEVINMALRNFGAGGGLPATVRLHKDKDKVEYTGSMILLSPSTIYLKLKDNAKVVIDRGPEVVLEIMPKK